VEVRVQDGAIWLSQKNTGLLFDTSTDNIGLHLKNIYAEGELNEVSTTEDFSVVQMVKFPKQFMGILCGINRRGAENRLHPETKFRALAPEQIFYQNPGNRSNTKRKIKKFRGNQSIPVFLKEEKNAYIYRQ
jgi:hypothetical protein